MTTMAPKVPATRLNNGLHMPMIGIGTWQALLFLSRGGNGAPCNITRLFYIAAIRSLIDYCAPCLPGLSDALFQSLEVAQNDAMRTILNAPRWTRIVTMLAECGLPTIRHRIYARAALAMARYLKTRPNSTLAAHLRHGFQRPPNTRPDGDWVHAMVDAARALGLEWLTWSVVIRIWPSQTIFRRLLGPPRPSRSFSRLALTLNNNYLPFSARRV
ncbi:hypothetical protein GWK47_019073 [Chionoecetes opilio]|uniref:Uncharacterized protein n=1 Tax=Chionoecetes opilio TaxID=41210 RepID=A0A8J4XR36_CHIOP|nr:hypothetical protein GWK47_019073 [Chionoecetes opilio]